MDTEQTSIKLDISEWNIKTETRSKDRMKLKIKLSKDEAVAFKNFSDICKPEDVTEDDFLKTIFITGVETMNNQLSELVQKYASENKEELAASGITVIDSDDGQVRLAETEAIEKDMSGV